MTVPMLQSSRNPSSSCLKRTKVSRHFPLCAHFGLSFAYLSPRRALLFITIAALLCYVPIALVFSIYDSTEVAIQKMIEASQRIITIGSNTDAIEGAPSIGMTPATKRHLELQIKTLRNAPRDPDKLESLLKLKRRQKEKTMERKDAERLLTEIEMLKVVLFLVCRNIKGREE